MRVLVFGSRDWTARAVIVAVLEGLLVEADDMSTDLTVIDGCARGADQVAHQWWNTHRINVRVLDEHYPADWRRHGKAAGPIRNARMVEQGKPDVAWGFITKPLQQSRGSFDMWQRLRAAEILTYLVHAP